jgi:NAD(P)-dependent dehydrogenase (short-subunit alcohol dehydrogenase family)
VAEYVTDTPMKRPAQPEVIAPAYVYFPSEADSSYVIGEVLTLLGGDDSGLIGCLAQRKVSSSPSRFRF